MTNPVPNARPKILGIDEHVANLVGNAGVDTHGTQLNGTAILNQGSIVSDGINGNSSSSTFKSRISPFINTVLATCALGQLVIGDKVVLSFSYFVPTSWAIQKNGVTILSGTSASLDKDNNSFGNLFLIDNITINQSYTYTLITTLNGGTLFSMALQAIKIGVTDTHVADLTGLSPVDSHVSQLDGENLQRTHETGIIQ